MKNESKETKNDEPSEPSGVFVTKGMQISIPNFSIFIDENGQLTADPVTLHTGLDLCPYWLDIAFEHLLDTEKANDGLMSSKANQNDEQIGVELAKEFTAGMQSIMASAIAIDAYYACVTERIEIPNDLRRVWREKKTARYAQVAEVLRIAFRIKNGPFKQLRTILKEIYDFRDRAVHPPSGTTAPALHPELNKITDWRYVVFRFYNAKAIVGLSLSIIMQTANQPQTDKFPDLGPYCESLKTSLQPLLNQWTVRYGRL